MPTVVVGLATETDTALAVTAARTYAIGLATETDTALAVSSSQTVVTALVRGLVQCEVAALPVVNAALVKLGAARIDSLVQEHPNAYVAHDIYLDELDAELRAHVWNFAKTKRRLAQSGTAPVCGWDRSYPFPVDCLRVVAVHGDDDEAYAPPYEIVGRAIQTDSIECWLTYIRRECDYEVADASFFEVMAYRLAIEMVGAVTGTVSDRDKVRKGYRRAVLRARSVDAIEDYPEQMPESPWVTERGR